MTIQNTATIYNTPGVYNQGQGGGGGGIIIPEGIEILSSLRVKKGASAGSINNIGLPLETTDKVIIESFLIFGAMTTQRNCSYFFECGGFSNSVIVEISSGNNYNSNLTVRVDFGGIIYYSSNSYFYNDLTPGLRFTFSLDGCDVNGVTIPKNSGTAKIEEGYIKSLFGSTYNNSCPFIQVRVYDQSNNLKYKFLPAKEKESGDLGVFEIVSGNFYKVSSNDVYLEGLSITE